MARKLHDEHAKVTHRLLTEAFGYGSTKTLRDRFTNDQISAVRLMVEGESGDGPIEIGEWLENVQVRRLKNASQSATAAQSRSASREDNPFPVACIIEGVLDAQTTLTRFVVEASEPRDDGEGYKLVIRRIDKDGRLFNTSDVIEHAFYTEPSSV
jgi:hypothetical protein